MQVGISTGASPSRQGCNRFSFGPSVSAPKKASQPLGRIFRLDLGADHDIGVHRLFVGENFGLGLLRVLIRRRFRFYA